MVGQSLWSDRACGDGRARRILALRDHGKSGTVSAGSRRMKDASRTGQDARSGWPGAVRTCRMESVGDGSRADEQTDHDVVLRRVRRRRQRLAVHDDRAHGRCDDLLIRQRLERKCARHDPPRAEVENGRLEVDRLSAEQRRHRFERNQEADVERERLGEAADELTATAELLAIELDAGRGPALEGVRAAGTEAIR